MMSEYILVFLVAGCSLLYAASALNLMSTQRKPKQILVFVLLGLGLHTALLLRTWHYQLTTVSLGNVASLFSWGFVILGVLAYYLHNNRISLLVSQIVATCLIWAPLLFDGQRVLEDSWGLRFHIVLSIASYAVLSFAALNAVLYLIQSYRLKMAKNMFGIKLPLNYLQKMMGTFTWLGEVTLTLSLVSGLLFINSDLLTRAVFLKLVITMITWLVIIVIFVMRSYYGMRSKKMAVWLIVVNALLLVAYFGTPLLSSIFY